MPGILCQRRCLLSVIVLLCSASGCESGPDPGTSARADQPEAAGVTESPAAALPSACEVLPPAEVTTVVGAPARDSLALDMTGEDGGRLTQCNYTVGNDLAAVSLMVRATAPGASLGSSPASVRTGLEEAGLATEEVAGLGDQAFFGFNQLHVFRGRYYLIVTPQAAAGLPQARILAERALAKLGAS